MKGTVLYAPRDVRFEDREAPKIIKPTDAVIRTSATCVCGSDLWPYRGISHIDGPTPMGHEYCGIVEEVGSAVRTVKPGQFVIGSFFVSDNTCPNCRAGYQSSCVQREVMSTAQAPVVRVPLADGTLVSTPDLPPDDLIPSLLTLSDVMGTGWFAAFAANVKPGMTVAVVGDGAVGLLGVLSAKQMGAEKIIAMSRHEARQKMAREFGATDIVAERGDSATEAVLAMTGGLGVEASLECVGTNQSMATAFAIARPGSTVGAIGAPHGIEVPIDTVIYRNVGLRGGVSPARKYLPELLGDVLAGRINPGRVFDFETNLDGIQEAYAAMDERRAIKSLVRIGTV
jgi:threonine dehydrogenase-like Zn-dependent dehydrogenase